MPHPIRAAVHHVMIALSAVLFVLLLGGRATAQPVARASATLFPPAAAPGEQVWLTAPRARRDITRVWVGGTPTPASVDSRSGWLTFTVPPGAAPGSQDVSVSSPGAASGVSLTVLPPDQAASPVVVYVNAAALKDIRSQYGERLGRVASLCNQSCPAPLLETIRALGRLALPELTPLQTGVSGRRARPAPLRALPGLRSVTPAPGSLLQALPPLGGQEIVAARAGSFCGDLAGLLETRGLPTGQVLALLNLLFQGDLATDPGTMGHPTQAGIPFEGVPPADTLGKLDVHAGSGKGVVIHVLDTASATDDPFVLHRAPGQPAPMYYTVPLDTRPYHGRVVAEVAHAAAPSASIRLHQVCDADGRCSTLKVVQALCAVAQEARQGGRHVVNLSVGGPFPTLGVKLALREVASLDVPTAASYGNRDDCVGHAAGDRCHHFPADWWSEFVTGPAPDAPTMLLSVAGWDINPDLEEYATYNRAVVIPWAPTPLPSVLAPGEFWSGGLPYFGTSFAAPVVSGMLAGWMSCRPGVPALPLVTAPHQNPLASVMTACP